MTKAKLCTFAAVVVALSSFPRTAYPDMWGGDDIILGQILANAIEQLSQLRSLLSTGSDTLGLLQDVNRGINDSLMLYQTVSPNTSPGLYGQWANANQALAQLQQIYGTPVPSPNSTVQKDADQSAAEAIAHGNASYAYTGQVDAIGEEIKSYSHDTSPGGAAKLTAESTGVMLNVMNESLRTQASSLKLQAQTLAIENRRDKEMTTHLLTSSNQLSSAMKSEPADFTIPRF